MDGCGVDEEKCDVDEDDGDDDVDDDDDDDDDYDDDDDVWLASHQSEKKVQCLTNLAHGPQGSK